MQRSVPSIFFFLIFKKIVLHRFIVFDFKALNSLTILQFSDGCLDLILMKDCPRLPLLKLMTELDTGGHVKSPLVSYLKVSS